MPRSSKYLSIVIDRQEIVHGHAWKFPKANVTIANLIPHGADYSIRGLTGILGVERKSYVDYIRCIGAKWREFQKQLEKLEKNKYACVIVEGRMTDYIVYSNITHDFVAYRTTQIISRGIPVLFCDSVTLAQKCCLDYLQHSLRRLNNAGEIEGKTPNTTRAVASKSPSQNR